MFSNNCVIFSVRELHSVTSEYPNSLCTEINGHMTSLLYVVKQKCTTANVVIYSDISLLYYQKIFC